RVISFEPNPYVLPTLAGNLEHWKRIEMAPVQIESVALSDHNGTGSLGFPADYKDNLGVATLELDNGTVPVPLKRLDSFQFSTIGVVKLDDEGHEAKVLSGAEALLNK